MTSMRRRSVLRASLAAVATSTLMRPYLANAAATTATVWWVQGFTQEEDVAFRKIVADYQRASGNIIEYSLLPYAQIRQKIVSAMTSGAVPDLFQNNPAEIVALYAWEDKLVDVSEVVATQKEHYTEAALLSTYCYNRIEKRRSFYGVPYAISVSGNHIWGSLVQKAGYTIEDIPKTWDAFYDFFKGVQKKLGEQGMRQVYGLGFQLTTNGADPNSTFHTFLIAYGGQNIVTRDGKLRLDDPQVREAAIKALAFPTIAYKLGFVPLGAINWNDADDNNAFHAKQIVMYLDGSISTEIAVLNKKDRYDDIVTMGLPLSNAGNPVPSQARTTCGLIPKGALNIAVAKEFLKYLIEPNIVNEYLKVALGRNVPCMPSIVKRDPWWFADPHRKAYTTQALLDPTIADFWAFNPGYAQVLNEHVWPIAWADILTGFWPRDAAEKAFKRVEEIFSDYPIA
jgi:multiple sugar transport system substrate-binding protein